MQVASAAISGDLSNHPMIMGLALQCKRKMEKQSRGITTMKGRRSKETEKEMALIADSGLQLALGACNPGLAAEFGLARAALRISLDELNRYGLPSPALALLFDGVMKDNFELADQRFPRNDEMAKRNMAIL